MFMNYIPCLFFRPIVNVRVRAPATWNRPCVACAFSFEVTRASQPTAFALFRAFTGNRARCTHSPGYELAFVSVWNHVTPGQAASAGWFNCNMRQCLAKQPFRFGRLASRNPEPHTRIIVTSSQPPPLTVFLC